MALEEIKNEFRDTNRWQRAFDEYLENTNYKEGEDLSPHVKNFEKTKLYDEIFHKFMMKVLSDAESRSK